MLHIARCGADKAAVGALRRALARNYTLVEAQLRQPGGPTSSFNGKLTAPAAAAPVGDGGATGAAGGAAAAAAAGGAADGGGEKPLPAVARLELAALLESNRTRGKLRIEEAGRRRQVARAPAIRHSLGHATFLAAPLIVAAPGGAMRVSALDAAPHVPRARRAPARASKPGLAHGARLLRSTHAPGCLRRHRRAARPAHLPSGAPPTAAPSSPTSVCRSSAPPSPPTCAARRSSR